MSRSSARPVGPWAVAAFLAALTPAPLPAAPCVDYAAQPRRIANVPLPEPRDITIDGSHAYIADRQAGLVVFDLDVDPPAIVSELGGLGFVYAVEVQAGVAYVTSSTGLQLIDVSDPAAPSLLGGLPLGYSYGVAVEGSIACVARSLQGLHFVDVSDPADPVLLSVVDVGYASRIVQLVDGWAHVASGDGYWIVDATDPAAPVVTGSDHWSGDRELCVLGNITVVAPEMADDLLIYDTTDRSNPVRISSLDTWSGGGGIDRIGDTVILGNGSFVSVVDVSDPHAPRETGQAAMTGGAALAVRGHRAYGVDWDTGLDVLDLEDITSPAPFARVTATGGGDVAIDGGLAAVASGNDGLYLVDVSNPAAAAVVGQIDTGKTQSVAIAGNQVLAGDDTGRIDLLDVSDPTTPVITGSVASRTGAIVFDPPYAYAGGGALDVVDCSDPAAPEVVGSVTGWWWSINDIAIRGDLAFASSQACWYQDCSPAYGFIQVVDVSEPTAPAIVSETQVGYQGVFPRAITVQHDYAYVASGNDVVILDVSAPQAPVIAGGVTAAHGVLDLDSTPETLYLATQAAVEVWDLADPLRPAFLGDQAVRGGRSVTLAGGLVFAGTDSDGLVVAPEQCGAAATFAALPVPGMDRLVVQPNPARGAVEARFALPRAAATRVTIHDVSGRRLATLWDGRLSAGAHVVPWDGRVRGARASAGVYFLRAEGGGETRTGRIVLLR